MRFIKLSIILLSTICISMSCKDDVPDKDLSGEDMYFEDYEEPYLKWGFINTNGENVIEQKYDDLRPFTNGLAIANYKGKWGFINAEGETIIDHQYRSAFPFKNGLARVQNFDKKYGFINTKGEMVIPDTFSLVFDFDSGLARAKKNQTYGYINTAGKWAIRSNFKKSSNFENGLAKVYQFGNAALIDTTGKYKIPLEAGNQKIYDTSKNLIRTKKDDKYYFYSSKDFSLVSGPYEDATDYNNNYAAIKENGRWFFINNVGRKGQSFDAEKVKIASKDRWILKQGKSYILVDSKTNEITTKNYDMIFPYSEGFAPYQIGEFWGYLDNKGKEVMKPVLPLAWEFQENHARIINNGKITYIDTTMQIIIPKGFMDAHNFSEGLAHVQ